MTKGDHFGTHGVRYGMKFVRDDVCARPCVCVASHEESETSMRMTAREELWEATASAVAVAAPSVRAPPLLAP